MQTRLISDARGTAVVEFALLAPVLLAMLAGIIGYGGWFWMAHTLQQAVNDAARAAIAGLSLSEKQALASNVVATDLVTASGLDPARATVTVTESSEMVKVRVRYDATGTAFFALAFVPLPSPVIERAAAIRAPAP